MHVALLYHPSWWWSTRSTRYYLPVVTKVIDSIRTARGAGDNLQLPKPHQP
jgi:hypothetical protein